MIGRRVRMGAALIILCSARAEAAHAPIVIATGPEAGFALPLGGAICRLVEQVSRRRGDCLLVATEGSVDDLERLRQGEVNLAIVQSDIAADALSASGAFSGKTPFPTLRGIAGFYPQALTVLARSDGAVKQVDDLKGKRVVMGEPNMPDPLFADFLEGQGWTKADLGGIVEMPRGDQIAALCAGKVDAVAVTAPHPNGFVRAALSAACPITILDLGGAAIDAVTATHPAYAPAALDLAVYGGESRVVHSFGPRAVLITTTKLSDVAATEIVAAIDKHGDALRKAHPAFASLDHGAVFSSRGLGVERLDAVSRFLIDNKIADPASGE